MRKRKKKKLETFYFIARKTRMKKLENDFHRNFSILHQQQVKHSRT